MNARNVSLVFGYLPGVDYPNPCASKYGVNQRFAVVLPTYRSDKAETYFDSELFLALVSLITTIVPHTEIRLYMDKAGLEVLSSIEDLKRKYRKTNEDEREPFYSAELIFEQRTVCYLETEWYVLVGGSAPYHDSYTLSVYLAEYDRSHLQQKFSQLCAELNAQIDEIYVGEQAPRVSLWNRLQHRLQW